MPQIPFLAVVTTGCLTVVLASVLTYALLDRNKKRDLNATKSAETSAAAVDANTTLTAVDLERYPGGVVNVYFATQTGTAESFARQLEREGTDRGFLVHVVDLEDISTDLAKLDHQHAIFLTATYGEGEAPDHATQFVSMLKEAAGVDILGEACENISPEALKHLDYAVFGLGNKQYDHYNAMGKFFDNALDKVGGKRILPLGLGDDDEDLEADFEAWKDKCLWPSLVKKYVPGGTVKQQNGSKRSKKLPDSPLQVIYHSEKTVATDYDLPMDQVHSSSRHYFTAFECPVKTVRELRSAQDSDSTVHVEIDIAAAAQALSMSHSNKLTYTTADNFGVLPVNDSAVVSQVAAALQYNLDAVFSVQAAEGSEWHGAPFPMPCTVRECLTRYCDLTSAPRRSDLKLLAAYCSDTTDQKALLRMASKEGRAEYKEKILDSLTGLVDLLKLCPSIQMPLEHFLNVCSALQTRFFTISSSSSVHPDTVHLTVAVTKHQRNDGSMFNGLCSTHLAHCSSATTVRVFHRPSTFRLPADASRPILMVGPGTGVAPMRAFLQERAYQKQKLKLQVGFNILYFGCKKEAHDFIYKDELQNFQESGVLDHLRIAFSREQSEKVYVQHLIKQNADETWRLISEEAAHIYVCGGVKMGQEVSEALKEIISSHGGMSVDAAKDYLAKLSHDGRFIQELWA